MDKKAITSVVGTALLLVVAVVSVIYFQSSFQTYQTGILSNSETKSKHENNLKIETIAGDYLYLNSNSNISTLKIQDSTGIEICNLNDLYHPNLKHYFSFDENNITYINDLIEPLSYGFSDKSSPSDTSFVNWTPNGYLNGAFIGEGKNTEKLNILLNDNPSQYKTLTMSFWIKPGSYSNLDGDNFFWIHEGPSIRHYIDSIQVYLATEGVYSQKYTNEILQINQWNHLVVSINTTIDLKHEIKIYLNGNETTYYQTHLGSGNLRNTQNQTFFSTKLNTYLGNFNGSIDEYKIYNKILNETEVQELYTNNKVSLNFDSNIQKYNLKSCDLEKGKNYEVVTSNGKSLISKEIIAR